MNFKQSDLPDYSSPPVVETVLGIQFEPLRNFLIPHFGRFWSLIEDDFPTIEVKHPIPIQFEKIGKRLDHQEPTVEMVDEPQARCWFISSDKTKLLQVQQDHFIYNWKKVVGDDAYPHYANLKPCFESEWRRFTDFLQKYEIDSPKINQCEVSYVNHLEQGVGWDNFGELANITPYWTGEANESFLPEPDIVLLNVRYLLPKRMGRLHILLQPAIRHSDGKEIMQLSLTVRGKPKTPDFGDVLDWLDAAQEWIVKGFTGFTTPKMQALWGRRERE